VRGQATRFFWGRWQARGLGDREHRKASTARLGLWGNSGKEHGLRRTQAHTGSGQEQILDSKLVPLAFTEFFREKSGKEGNLARNGQRSCRGASQQRGYTRYAAVVDRSRLIGGGGGGVGGEWDGHRTPAKRKLDTS